MTIKDEVRNILVLEAFAAEATRIAADKRASLNEAARRQLESEGVAPSWTLPGIAKVGLSFSKPATVVADAAKLTAWIIAKRPELTEQITRVRPADQAAFLVGLDTQDGVPVDRETGEIVPGIEVRPGGQPKSLNVIPDAEVKATLSGQVAQMLATAHPSVVGTTEAAPALPSDPWVAAGDPWAAFAPAGGES